MPVRDQHNGDDTTLDRLMDIEVASHADIGGRDEQQDRIAVLRGQNALLVVLADGMGGHEDGALAAQTVIETARNHFAARNAGNPADLLTRIAMDSHGHINAIGNERDTSPHSTCVLLHIGETITAWAHVGDSRLYRFDRGCLQERTTDHSIVEIMRLQGRISETEMKNHPSQNQLYGALGGERRPEVETCYRNTRNSDAFLLASDGLWGNVLEAEMESVIKSQDLAIALLELVQKAKTRGGRRCDNISVAAIRHR